MHYKQQIHLEEDAMKELLRKFEDLWVSIAFAEAGEHEASREFLVQEAFEVRDQEIYTVA
jgi:hypothetical protein